MGRTKGFPKKGAPMGDGAGDDAKGRLKKAGGEITGDDSLKREGEVDKASRQGQGRGRRGVRQGQGRRRQGLGAAALGRRSGGAARQLSPAQEAPRRRAAEVLLPERGVDADERRPRRPGSPRRAR